MAVRQQPRAMRNGEAPLVTFGTLGDVQHSCKRNGVKIRGPRVRNRYNETSLELLCQAIDDWKHGQIPVSFILNLGNLTEMHDEPGYDRDQALVTVLNALERFPRPKYHIIGHHDLKQFTRREFRNSKIHSAVNAPGAIPANHDKFFYHFSPTPGVRVVVIDTLEVALVGYDDNLQAGEYKRAVSILRNKNPNRNVRETDGMAWQDSKYTCINGAVTNIQLQWLVEVLDYAEKNGELVITAGHNPLCATDKQRYAFVPWNNDEILSVLHKYSCVVAYFASHDLDGGYIQDDHGIHHITMPGIVETPPCSNAHGTVHMMADRLEVVGVGRCPSMTLYYHGRGKGNAAPQLPQQQPHPVQTRPLALSPVAPPQVVVPVKKVQAVGNLGTVRAQGGCEPARVVPDPLPPGRGRPPPIVMAEMERQAAEAAQQPMAHGAQQGQPQPQQIVMPQIPPVPQLQMGQIPQVPQLGQFQMPQIPQVPQIPQMPQMQVPQGQQDVQQQQQQQQVPDGNGKMKRMVPVTVAVPIEKLKAMGGIQNFQLADMPKDMNSAVDIAGHKVWANDNGQGKTVKFAT